MNKIKMIPVAIVLIAVSAILITTVIVPVTNQGNTNPDAWYYDDYRTSDGISSVSGALELKTVGATTYVHANGVGSATITYTDESTKTINVQKANLDVIFMWGQSNAAYRNPNISLVDKLPALGTGYYFGLSNRYATLSTENDTAMDVDDCDFYTLYDSSGTLRVGSMLPDFVYEYNKATGHKVYFIDGAVGGRSLDYFLPDAGYVWTFGEDMLSDGIDAIDTSKFNVTQKYYIWLQGEGNKTTAVATYKTQFLEMHDALLNGDLGGHKFDACFMSKVRAENGGNASTAQEELCKEYSTIIMASTVADTFTVANGLMGSDNLHYSQLGNNLLGSTLGQFIGHYVSPYYVSSPTTASLLAVIPLLVVIGLVVATVAVFIKN